jgi:cytochrome c biogenesis protein
MSQEIISATDTHPKKELKRKTPPLLDRAIAFLSSVRFGVFILVIMVILSVLGMIIIQQNVQGFDTYYATRTPAEKLVFAFLGLFDIYHSWYYNLFLLVLSLNIILASIDRFPGAWSYISKPKTDGTKPWILSRPYTTPQTTVDGDALTAQEKVAEGFRKFGLKPKLVEKNGYLYVFGESGRLNRLGAYIVHVFLLILFLGHFVALQTGFDADVNMMPGQESDQIELININLDKTERYAVQLPFTITCTDVQQKLLNPNGEIEVSNTLDWRTQIRIDDPEYGVTVADVSLNKPFHYRGYRFFQAQTVPVGSAREMELRLRPADGGQPVTVNLARYGTMKGKDGEEISSRMTLEDGTVIEYDSFQPDFILNGGQPDTKSQFFNNPAVVLNVTPPGGNRVKVFAFANDLPDDAPINAPVAGYRWKLQSFEKAPYAHVLSIKFDPYDGAFIAWYVGGTGLMGALVFVFFVSHRRYWAMIEPSEHGNNSIVLAGETNRNFLGFKDRFKRLESAVNKELGIVQEDK